MLTVMAAGLVAPITPDVAEEFEHVPNAGLLARLLLSIPAFFIALTAPFSGYLVDRYGRLRLLYLGLTLYAISGSTGYYLDNLYVILIGRAFLGISIGIIMTVAITLVGDYFEGDQRRRFVGQQSAFIGFSGVAFLSLSGVLAEYNWKLPFLIYLFPLVLIPVVITSLSESKKSGTNVANIEWRKLSSLTFFLFLNGTIIMMLMYLIPTQFPFILKESGINDHSISGNVLAFHALGMVLSSLAYPWIKKRSEFVSVFLLGFILMGVSYYMLGLSTTLTPMIISVFIGGISFGFLISNSNLWIIETTRPEQRGRIIGILTSCLFLGQFLSPLLAEPIVQYGGFAFLFKTSSGITLIVALAIFGFARYGPRRAKGVARK